jgi:hypothetical protein
MGRNQSGSRAVTVFEQNRIAANQRYRGAARWIRIVAEAMGEFASLSPYAGVFLHQAVHFSWRLRRFLYADCLIGCGRHSAAPGNPDRRNRPACSACSS